MPEGTQCVECIHFRGLSSCEAFPDKIPEEIFTGLIDHSKPYPNDQGIQYEKRKDVN